MTCGTSSECPVTVLSFLHDILLQAHLEITQLKTDLEKLQNESKDTIAEMTQQQVCVGRILTAVSWSLYTFSYVSV